MSTFIFTITVAMVLQPGKQSARSPAAGEQFRIGAAAADVRAAWGSPHQISRQVLHGRYVEQWFYAKKNVWINFDGSKGEEPRVRYVFPEG